MGTRSAIPAARMRSTARCTRERESPVLSASASRVVARPLEDISSNSWRASLSLCLPLSPFNPRSRISASSRSSPSTVAPGSAISIWKPPLPSSLGMTILSSDSVTLSATSESRRSSIARACTETRSTAALIEPPRRTWICQRPSVSAATSPDSLSFTS